MNINRLAERAVNFQYDSNYLVPFPASPPVNHGGVAQSERAQKLTLGKHTWLDQRSSW